MNTAPNSAPISSHPAFKWAVAAWFAALMGLGLLVMPAGVHADIASATGLASVLPEGSAIGIALAALAALLGLLLGLVIAGRIAAANAVETDAEDVALAEGPDTVWLADAAEPVLDQAPRRRVFNPREELGEDGIAAPAEPEADPVTPDEIPAFDSSASDAFEESPPEDFASSALMDEWRAETGAAEPEPSLVADEESSFEAEPEPTDEAHEPEMVEDEWEPVPEQQVPPPRDFAEEAPAEEAQPAVAVENDEFPTQSETAAVELEDDEAGAAEIEPAMGDMPLPALTERLRRALAAQQQAEAARAAAAPQTEDQVIAFLRREADRAPQAADDGFTGDPQAVLRSALDKLSRVSNPK